MKRDMDLIRTILLRIEDNNGQRVDFRGGPVSDDVIYYHLKLLEQAGFVRATFTGQGIAFGDEITWNGHEFLDNIRSETVWNAIKKQAGGAFGTVSLGIIAEMAKVYIKTQLGIP